jgi:hypothetical protein
VRWSPEELKSAARGQISDLGRRAARLAVKAAIAKARRPRRTPETLAAVVAELLPEELWQLRGWIDAPGSPDELLEIIVSRAVGVRWNGGVRWDPSFELQGPVLVECASLGQREWGTRAREAWVAVESVRGLDMSKTQGALLLAAFNAVHTIAWVREHPREVAYGLAACVRDGLPFVVEDDEVEDGTGGDDDPESSGGWTLALRVAGPLARPSSIVLQLTSQDTSWAKPLPVLLGPLLHELLETRK